MTHTQESTPPASQSDEALKEALLQHNDLLRSACSIADRDGRDTNWLTFRGACHYTLAEHHDLVTKVRANLNPDCSEFRADKSEKFSQSDEALINVGPINRIPGTDSISCPGLPSGMMCLGWGEQGWAINDKDGKRIAAGNWGECATLPASQSEVLAEARHEMDIFDRPSKRTSLRLIRRVEELEAENARLREALTPSGYTKAAYIGEFHFREPDFDECGGRTYRHVAVPWTTIKEIMTAIAARAALKDKQP